VNIQEIADIHLAFPGFYLFNLGIFTFTAGSVVTILAGLAVACLAWSRAERPANACLSRRARMPRGVHYTIAPATQIMLVATTIFITLKVSGVNLTGLAVVLSLLTLGLYVRPQNLPSNFVSGVLLLFVRPVQAGDRVVTEGVAAPRAVFVHQPSARAVETPNRVARRPDV